MPFVVSGFWIFIKQTRDAMKYSSRRISVRFFLTLGSYEEEEGFREVLKSLSQRGIFIAGLLEAIAVSLSRTPNTFHACLSKPLALLPANTPIGSSRQSLYSMQPSQHLLRSLKAGYGRNFPHLCPLYFSAAVVLLRRKFTHCKSNGEYYAESKKEG